MKKEKIFLTTFFILSLYCVCIGQISKEDLVIKKKISRKFSERAYCEEGIDNAVRDYSKGIRKIYIWGEGYVDSSDLLFRKILTSDYGIQIEHLGCVVSSDDQCYSNFMYTKIELENGKDFFVKLRKQVKIALAK
jgi:hypothetical protein